MCVCVGVRRFHRSGEHGVLVTLLGTDVLPPVPWGYSDPSDLSVGLFSRDQTPDLLRQVVAARRISAP